MLGEPSLQMLKQAAARKTDRQYTPKGRTNTAAEGAQRYSVDERLSSKIMVCRT